MKVLSKNSVMEFVKKTAILWVMIILILILSVISPSFFRGQNLLNIIKQASITGVIGVGMTFVLITGGIDLSVGSVMALSGTMAASVAVAEKNMPIALVILVGVGLGALCGLINGIGVSYIGFPPFIMTLGMMTIARGIPLVFTNGTPIFGLSEEFNMIANSRVLGVPSLVIFLVITVLIAVVPLFVLKEAEFGGSDDAGSVMVEEIHGEYEPWFTPVLETALDRELPGEIESLIFCIQTGIGVGIIAFIMGRFVERKKWTDSLGDNAFEVLREKQKS